MTEEELRRLEKEKRELESARAEFKGILQGLRLTELNPTDKAFLQLIEWMINGFMNVRDDIISSKQEQLRMTQRLEGLEARVQQLEETLRKLEEWK